MYAMVALCLWYGELWWVLCLCYGGMTDCIWHGIMGGVCCDGIEVCGGSSVTL